MSSVKDYHSCPLNPDADNGAAPLLSFQTSATPVPKVGWKAQRTETDRQQAPMGIKGLLQSQHKTPIP